VYLLETKKLEGSVEIDNRVPRLLRRHDPQADPTFQSVGPRTLDAARRIKTHIQYQTGHRLWVQAIVVFWSDFPEQIVEADRCVYIHGPRLRVALRATTHRTERITNPRGHRLRAGLGRKVVGASAVRGQP